MKHVWKTVVGLVLGVAAVSGPANAQEIIVDVDASLADRILGIVCSYEPVDEAHFRASPLVQAQIDHHTTLSQRRNIDALLRGLTAAAECEVPDDDVFQLGAVVENREEFAETVEFLKRRAPEIREFVSGSLAPYVPEQLTYRGSIVLSIVGNPCGGFASGEYFFLALNCVTSAYEEEYSALEVVSAHEVYHALQSEFFHPDRSDLDRVDSLDDALRQLFWWLMGEGTAEYAVDSRQIEGSGRLTDILTDFARNGYAQVPLYIRFFSYTAEVLTAGEDDYRERLMDVYELGFAGSNRQLFYYAGAAMTGHIDRTYGRDALMCVLQLPPEEFVRAYHAAASAAPSDEAVPLSATVVEAAERMSRARADDLGVGRCIE